MSLSETPDAVPPTLPRRGEPAASVPREPAPLVSGGGGAAWWFPILGLAIIVACLKAGDAAKHLFGLILPGNMLGLFILLSLLTTGLVPLRWVESAARWLLWLLPFLFMPIFILALKDHAFWLTQGRDLAGAVLAGTFFLWGATGHLAQWMLRRTAARSAEAIPDPAR